MNSTGLFFDDLAMSAVWLEMFSWPAHLVGLAVAAIFGFRGRWGAAAFFFAANVALIVLWVACGLMGKAYLQTRAAPELMSVLAGIVLWAAAAIGPLATLVAGIWVFQRRIFFGGAHAQG